MAGITSVFMGMILQTKLEKFGFKVEIFKITEAEAKLDGIASGDFNDEIFIAKKVCSLLVCLRPLPVSQNYSRPTAISRPPIIKKAHNTIRRNESC